MTVNSVEREKKIIHRQRDKWKDQERFCSICPSALNLEVLVSDQRHFGMNVTIEIRRSSRKMAERLLSAHLISEHLWVLQKENHYPNER